jgi:hypothetical protein
MCRWRAPLVRRCESAATGPATAHMVGSRGSRDSAGRGFAMEDLMTLWIMLRAAFERTLDTRDMGAGGKGERGGGGDRRGGTVHFSVQVISWLTE